ncbi:MAG: DUF4012 domain-containing protein [Acidimicrobiales bacterium]
MLAGAALLVSVGQPAAFVVGVATLALAVGANWFRRRHRRMGALIGAISAQLLLHGGDLGLHGLTAVVALAAPVPCAVSAWRLLPPSTRSRSRKIGSWAALGLLVVVGGGLVALTQALPEARRGAERVRAGVTSLNQGDVEEAERELDRATEAFARSRDAVTSVLTIPARVLPLANPHLDAIEQVATAGADLTATAADAARDTDYGALAVTDGRIDLDRFAELRPALEQVQGALTDADANLAQIDVSSLVVPAADAVTELRTKIADTIPTVGHAIRGTELAPGMLGADGRRRWIIGFTSPAEARGLGGFLGYYSVVEAVDGEVDIVASGRVPDLNRADGEADRTLVGPDDYLLRYGRLHPEDQLQDVTLSPDFPSVATVFESLYEQSTGTTADGMIVLDPYALAELLRITGPVTVDGVQLDESNAAEFLLRTQYAAYDDREVRGDVLDEVAAHRLRSPVDQPAQRPGAPGAPDGADGSPAPRDGAFDRSGRTSLLRSDRPVRRIPAGDVRAGSARRDQPERRQQQDRRLPPPRDPLRAPDRPGDGRRHGHRPGHPLQRRPGRRPPRLRDRQPPGLGPALWRQLDVALRAHAPGARHRHGRWYADARGAAARVRLERLRAQRGRAARATGHRDHVLPARRPRPRRRLPLPVPDPTAGAPGRPDRRADGPRRVGAARACDRRRTDRRALGRAVGPDAALTCIWPATTRVWSSGRSRGYCCRIDEHRAHRRTRPMRTSRLLIALAALFAGVFALAAPASAQYDPAVLSVSPANVAPGGDVTVSGSGCASGDAVTIAVAGASTTTTAGAGGAFSATVKAPSTAGTYTVTATCGVEVLSATLTVGAATTGSGALPVTGSSSTGPLAAGAIVLVAAGAALVAVSRRRSSATVS